MKIEINEIADYLYKKCPMHLETLSRKKGFTIEFYGDTIITFTNQYDYNGYTRIKLDYFYKFIIDVIDSKSLVGSDFSKKYNQVYRMLPIALEVLSHSEQDLSLYSKSEIFKHIPKIPEYKLFSFYSDRKLKNEDPIGSSKKSPHSIIDVYYATNREPVGGEVIFGLKRSENIYYGRASVSIPATHVSGKIEKPVNIGYGVFKVKFKENKDKHFTIENGLTLSKPEFFDKISKDSNKKSVTIFIHGFNVMFRSAIFKAAQIKFDLNYRCPMVLFSWPSNGNLVNYSGDKEQADYSAEKLALLLSDISNVGIEEILVIAHSMGSLCLSKAIEQLNSPTPVLDRLALAAPDIEKQIFLNKYYNFVVSACQKVTLYVSSTDKALKASKVANGSERLGDSEDKVTVLKGIETIDISEVDDSLFSLNHSYITQNNTVLTDLNGFLINNLSAVQRRLKSKLNSEDEEYWEIHSV